MSRTSTFASPLLAACILLVPGAFTGQEIGAAAGKYTFEVPFQEEPVSPEILTQPFALLSLRAKTGDPDGAERKITLVVAAANGSGKDQEATIEFTLLDAAGDGLATQVVEEEIEEGEMDEFSVKFRIPRDTASRVARIRVTFMGPAR